MKSFGETLLGIFLIVAMFAITGVVIWGAGWLANRVLPILNAITFFLLPVALLLFVPLGFFRGTRSFAGNALYISSYTFGLTLWMTGLLTTLQLWGLGAAIIGICLAGIGIVPVGMLASLFRGEWSLLATLVFLTLLTFGFRSLAIHRLTRAANEKEHAAMAALDTASRSPAT